MIPTNMTIDFYRTRIGRNEQALNFLVIFKMLENGGFGDRGSKFGPGALRGILNYMTLRYLRYIKVTPVLASSPPTDLSIVKFIIRTQ